MHGERRERERVSRLTYPEDTGGTHPKDKEQRATDDALNYAMKGGNQHSNAEITQESMF